MSVKMKNVFYFLVFCCAWNVIGILFLVNMDLPKNDETQLQTEKFISYENSKYFIRNARRSNSIFKFSLNSEVDGSIQSMAEDGTSTKFDFGDGGYLNIERTVSTELADQFEVSWIFGKFYLAGLSEFENEVCFHYGFNNAFWYSTYEERNQTFPMDTHKKVPKFQSFTTGFDRFAAVLEHVFVNSDGFALILNESQPIFLRRDPNQGDPVMCISVRNYSPYHDNSFDNGIHFTIIASSNIRIAYQEASNKFIDEPTSIPDERMFKYPIWSTWAMYKHNITEEKVMQFANEVVKHGFPNSQLQIDDKWELNYGDFKFDKKKFPNPKKMVEDLHEMGFRVTLWVYPFVNKDSLGFSEENMKYFVKDKETGQPLIVKWPNGLGVSVDFSNDAARKWFVNRLKTLKQETGIDSFKFDDGEMRLFGNDWEFQFSDLITRQNPSLISTNYVEAAVQLGNMIEVRVGYKTQKYPIFVRMLDKLSNWGQNNGLKALIPAALTFSLAGYSFILPDMIGGNANKLEWPSEELFIRWLQANTFLPSMQFSITPWNYTNPKVTEISRKFVNLHAEHGQLFIDLAQKRVQDGSPMIRPIWYAEPDDLRTYQIDDQFMVGEDLLVVPVVVEGQRQREIYLPSGKWIDQNGSEYQGPGLFQIKVPLEELAYFKRKY